MIPQAESAIVCRHEPVAQVEEEAADPHLLLVHIVTLHLLQMIHEHADNIREATSLVMFVVKFIWWRMPSLTHQLPEFALLFKNCKEVNDIIDIEGLRVQP